MIGLPVLETDINCARAHTHKGAWNDVVDCDIHDAPCSRGFCDRCDKAAKINPDDPVVRVPPLPAPRVAPQPVQITAEQHKALADAAAKAQEANDAINRALWEKIHRRPWLVVRLVLADELTFLEECIGQIAGPCTCKSDARKMVKEFPPDVSSREALAKRYWEYHQTVNAKFTPPKPGITFEEAMERYQQSESRSPQVQSQPRP